MDEKLENLYQSPLTDEAPLPNWYTAWIFERVSRALLLAMAGVVFMVAYRLLFV